MIFPGFTSLGHRSTQAKQERHFHADGICQSAKSNRKGTESDRRKPKNPKPGEWVSKDYSKHKVADYKPFNFVDGEGRVMNTYQEYPKIFI